jgi:diaminopimelate epimerase
MVPSSPFANDDQSMSTIPFIKYHGLGNDFVLVEPPRNGSMDWRSLAKQWCPRHTGIGADGVLVLSAPSDEANGKADIRMRIFNADGSEAQMCGNGIRCVARFMLERRAWKQPSLRVETGRGVLAVTIEAEAGRFIRATVDMGEPILVASEIPVRAKSAKVVDVLLTELCDSEWIGTFERACGEVPRLTCVSMGNPHAILFCNDVARVPLEQLGPLIEYDPLFPERTNVQFVQVNSPTAATVRTWERGAGPTLACGTGACAVLAAGVLTGRMSRAAEITLPGGPLGIRWDERTGHVFMTGPAAELFSGEWTLTS